jgi:succinate-acetate transporter protein
MAAQAFLQIHASGARNDSFPIASVSYRVIWNIPVFFLLAITSQIPRGLANILIIYDVMFIVVTVVLFSREHRVKTK